MARKSTISKLDPKIRTSVDAAIRDGRATIDDIVELIDKMGGEVSRSAVGRYKKNSEEMMKRWRDAQEVAGVWIKQLEDSPNDEVGRLLSEMLKTVAFNTMSQMGDEDAKVKPADIMFLAKSIKEVASADKITTERELKIRKEVLSKAAEAAETEAKSAGVSDDGIQRLRDAIKGAL